MTQFEDIGQGTIYVTNKRLVFVGPHQTVSIALPNVVKVGAFVDGVQVDSANNKPWIFQSGDVKLAAIVHRALHG